MMTFGRTTQRHAITFLTAFSLWTVWLPLTRTLTGGGSYGWGVDYFDVMYRGAGLEGHYLFLVLQAVLGIAIVYMGLRNPRAPFPALLVVWHGLNFANDVFKLAMGELNVFYGDTGGVAFDWTLLSPLVTGGMFMIACAWALRESLRPENLPETAGWTRRNAYFLGGFAVYLAVVTMFERTGEAHGLTDLFVVSLNILAPVLLALVLFPWKRRDTIRQPAAA